MVRVTQSPAGQCPTNDPGSTCITAPGGSASAICGPDSIGNRRRRYEGRALGRAPKGAGGGHAGKTPAARLSSYPGGRDGGRSGVVWHSAMRKRVSVVEPL
ncbi:hypothetical protein FA15DRAFT_658264 [Coprinopsis marcescibilis]|uniref:Uncharacterized protein n=1 Tax=Coprinopsis marcescibilis TaxID=230819 RepID=A0A5C3KMI7_COPMA|nr:hypothetical protein FA15DRAFT_658264 [Coprinopsis marcescibilis]